jgi:pimeloyl-ACP methyl ester carboxylesterase
MATPMVRMLVACLPDGVAWSDPDPAVTAGRGIEVVERWGGGPASILGWSDGGAAALALAAKAGELVDRLVLVSVPAPLVPAALVPAAPDDAPPPVDLASVRAKTLLLFGSSDERTGSHHGRWWQAHLPNARLEMVPGGGHDLVGEMWGRIAAFVAPGRGRVIR